MFDCHPSARLENHGVGNHQRLIAVLGVRLRRMGLDLEVPHVEESPDKKCIVDCEWVWVKSFGMSLGPIPLESLRLTKQMVLSSDPFKPGMPLGYTGPFFNECTDAPMW